MAEFPRRRRHYTLGDKGEKKRINEKRMRDEDVEKILIKKALEVFQSFFVIPTSAVARGL